LKPLSRCIDVGPVGILTSFDCTVLDVTHANKGGQQRERDLETTMTGRRLADSVGEGKDRI